jgi:hypothetical protein
MIDPNHFYPPGLSVKTRGGASFEVKQNHGEAHAFGGAANVLHRHEGDGATVRTSALPLSAR